MERLLSYFKVKLYSWFQTLIVRLLLLTGSSGVFSDRPDLKYSFFIIYHRLHSHHKVVESRVFRSSGSSFLGNFHRTGKLTPRKFDVTEETTFLLSSIVRQTPETGTKRRLSLEHQPLMVDRKGQY